MRLKLARSEGWKGPIRFVLRPGGAGERRGMPAVQVPERVGQTVVVAPRVRGDGTEVVVSLGKEAEISTETLRQAGGAVAGWLRSNKAARAGVETIATRRITPFEAVHALAEGLLLGSFRFDRHKSDAGKPAAPTVDLLVTHTGPPLAAALRKAEAVCGGTLLAREIAHEPPNVTNPVTLAKLARAVAGRAGVKCTVLDERQMAGLKMDALLAVGRGSVAPPRLIVLEYRPGRAAATAKPVIVVGKAITFDTGGYSLKPRDAITGMKYDKSGGTAVLGIIQAAATLRLRTPLVGIVAAAENMIAGNAYRPDDIIRTMSGKTVEIVSSDAEGRLVLCDALTYAQRKFKPRYLIDLATLTGGVVTALGRAAAGIFCNDERLQKALIDSGQRVRERLWPLPMWDEYFELLKGDDGDMKNLGNRDAASIQGAVFLKQFVDAKTPWAHIDIAGVASLDKDGAYCPKGATGFGVRLLMDFLGRL